MAQTVPAVAPRATDGRRASPAPSGEQAFRLLVDAVTDYAIFLVGLDGRVLTWNRGAERIKGWTAAEIIGQHFSHFYTAEDVERGLPEKVLAQAARHGRHEIESWRVRKDGTRFWADVVISALYDRHGKAYAYAKVTRDLTERRRAEQRERELALEQRARAAAEEALRARERFLSIASHELKTPLAILQVTTDALQRARERGAVSEERMAASLRRIDMALTRMGSLVNELLDVSRLGSGSMPFTMAPVEIRAIARDVIDSFDGRESHDRIDLIADGEHTIVGDGSRIEQVIVNLIDNALKYSSPPASIRVSISAEDGGVALAVSDAGIGLDDQQLARLFEPFERADEVAHIPGMGLGLFISRQIVERHGGHVSAASDGPGRGATFRVWLPSAANRPGVSS